MCSGCIILSQHRWPKCSDLLHTLIRLIFIKSNSSIRIAWRAPTPCPFLFRMLLFLFFPRSWLLNRTRFLGNFWPNLWSLLFVIFDLSFLFSIHTGIIVWFEFWRDRNCFRSRHYRFFFFLVSFMGALLLFLLLFLRFLHWSIATRRSRWFAMAAILFLPLLFKISQIVFKNILVGDRKILFLQTFLNKGNMLRYLILGFSLFSDLLKNLKDNLFFLLLRFFNRS